jgi:predicted metalloprotease with PDZ domain
MKIITAVWGCALLLLGGLPMAYAQGDPVIFTIDMTGPSTDTFLVEIIAPKLGKDNGVFQFASTAPGAYQVMDIGRYTSHFRAFDKGNREIPVRKIQTNQFEISSPKKVRRITYQVAETWDIPVSENVVYKMSGSSLEKDHALINIHTLLGYFHGMQDAEMEIRLVYPPAWTVGTALEFNENGRLFAPDFDFAVDSPILLGRLSATSIEIGGKEIEIFTYSKNDLIKSDHLMNAMRDVFIATSQFVKGFPIDRYVLLFHFEDANAGAWEHSYSSEYVLKEAPLDENYANLINGIAAHEIFHMVTPLNIHSELIEQFNFITPTPSQHLWLYEGVTEWASDMIRLRGGLITLEEFLHEISEKITIDGHFDKDVSLQKLAMSAFTSEGQTQYVNIYHRGALVPLLMDILLLEKSGGQKGLREVILDLAKKYGPARAFSEEDFYDEFVAMTQPEMRTIIDRYIIGAEPLPIAEYVEKLGIRYFPVLVYDEMIPDRGHVIEYNGKELVVSALRERSESEGLMQNDIVLAIDSIEAVAANFPEIIAILQGVAAGDTITYNVKRGEEVLELPLSVGEQKKTEEHVFRLMENASPEQIALREAWMRKLD